MFRSFLYRESAWELMALVVLTGGVATAYQASHHVLSNRWAMASVLATAVAILVGALIVWLR
jgi:hypothetical protein